MSYESEVLRNWYLLFHYGSPGEILDGVPLPTEMFPSDALRFPETTVEFFQKKEGNARALDVGCAVGRSTLEMTRIADEVIGIDFSQSFVDVAEKVRTGEEVTCLRYSERHLSDALPIRTPEGIHPQAASFEQGDAMNLRDDLGTFDLVHAANLLCRLPQPLRFLDRLPSLLNHGGELVIATPATWMDEYTPRKNQPESLTLDFLKENLGKNFDLVEVKELPFLIREHKRKLQISTSQTSLWRKR